MDVCKRKHVYEEGRLASVQKCIHVLYLSRSETWYRVRIIYTQCVYGDFVLHEVLPL